MISLNPGLKNSLIILELMRDDEEFCNEVTIEVACFQNCRETGLTFSMLFVNDKEGNSVMLEKKETFCVYENPYNQALMINGKTKWSGKSGDLPYRSDKRSDAYMVFEKGEYEECCNWLKKKFKYIRKEEFKKLGRGKNKK